MFVVLLQCPCVSSKSGTPNRNRALHVLCSAKQGEHMHQHARRTALPAARASQTFRLAHASMDCQPTTILLRLTVHMPYCCALAHGTPLCTHETASCDTHCMPNTAHSVVSCKHTAYHNRWKQCWPSPNGYMQINMYFAPPHKQMCMQACVHLPPQDTHAHVRVCMHTCMQQMKLWHSCMPNTTHGLLHKCTVWHSCKHTAYT